MKRMEGRIGRIHVAAGDPGAVGVEPGEYDRCFEVGFFDVLLAVALRVRAIHAPRDHARYHARGRRSRFQDGLLHL